MVRPLKKRAGSAGTVIATLLMLAAGLAAAAQAAIQGNLGSRIGVWNALGFATLVSAACGALLVMVVGRGIGGIADGLRAPPWLWLAGAFAALFMFSVTFATPRIGVIAVSGVFIAGQLIMAVVIERFGLLGLERASIAWPRLLGIALLAAGVALTLRR